MLEWKKKYKFNSSTPHGPRSFIQMLTLARYHTPDSYIIYTYISIHSNIEKQNYIDTINHDKKHTKIVDSNRKIEYGNMLSVCLNRQWLCLPSFSSPAQIFPPPRVDRDYASHSYGIKHICFSATMKLFSVNHLLPPPHSTAQKLFYQHAPRLYVDKTCHIFSSE